MSAFSDRVRLTIRCDAGTLVHMDQGERERIAENLLGSGMLSVRGYVAIKRHRHWYWRAWFWLSVHGYAAWRRVLTEE